MFVQIFASSACTGVVATIGAPSGSNSRVARSVEASPTPPTMHGSVPISFRKRLAAIRSGTCATKMSSPARKPRCFSRYPATNSVVPGAIVDRSTMRWPFRRTGSRSSSTDRTSPMSISIWENIGVPTVRTSASACAASAACWERSIRVRASSSSVPGSLNGIRPLRTAARRSGSLSMPTTPSPASAKQSARGRPTRPSPMTETSMPMWRETLAAAPVTQVLAREAGDEARVVAQVAPPQAAGLLGEPEHPLEPEALHPCGRLRDAAAVDVERRPHADQDLRRQPGAHACHPLLLLRDADPDPHDFGARAVDVGGHGGVLLGRQLAERGSVAADDPQPRIPQPQVPRELGQNARRAPAVQVHLPARTG